MNDANLKFTVFTPAFNRRPLLGRVYESLKNQSYKNFEWIIVDDGSTDDTESLVSGWIEEKILPIRFFRQANAGKHAAINFGVGQAKGELFLIIDSDDRCVPEALEKFNYYWNLIAPEAKKDFSGIYSNCSDGNGRIIGRRFPKDILDGRFFDAYYKFGAAGDKWGFFRTDILRQYPFPIIGQENFLTEAVVWNRVALKFKTRFINESLLIVDYQSDGLSSRSLKLRIDNPEGAVLYYQEFLFLPVGRKWKIRNLLNYIRFSFHARIKIRRQAAGLKNSGWRFLYFLLLPSGYFIYQSDYLRSGRRHN